jgi:hypothetical protein
VSVAIDPGLVARTPVKMYVPRLAISGSSAHCPGWCPLMSVRHHDT